MSPYRFFFLVLGMVSLAGCARSGATVAPPEGWSEGEIRAHLRQLTEPVAAADSARAARRVLYAARRMEVAGLMPARDPSFLLAMGKEGRSPSLIAVSDPAQSHVLGYVTGRHPSYYDELVLVVADLDRPAAAAALEVARVLAEQARDTQVPERTVLFALWAPPRTGIFGLQDYLAHPTWGLDSVTRVLLVTADTAAVAESKRLLTERGLLPEVVTTSQTLAVPDGQAAVTQAFDVVRTAHLAETLYRRLRAVATVEDSTAAGFVEIQ